MFGKDPTRASIFITEELAGTKPDLNWNPPIAGLRSCAGSGCVPERIAYRNRDTTNRIGGHEARPGPLLPADENRPAPLQHCSGSEFLGSFLQLYTGGFPFTKSEQEPLSVVVFEKLFIVGWPVSDLADDKAVSSCLDDSDRDNLGLVDAQDALNMSQEPCEKAHVAAGHSGKPRYDFGSEAAVR
jgi:hypothetical protein